MDCRIPSDYKQGIIKKLLQGMGLFSLPAYLVPYMHYIAAFSVSVNLEWNSDDTITWSDSAADVVLLCSVLNDREPR